MGSAAEKAWQEKFAEVEKARDHFAERTGELLNERDELAAQLKASRAANEDLSQRVGELIEAIIQHKAATPPNAITDRDMALYGALTDAESYQRPVNWAPRDDSDQFGDLMREGERWMRDHPPDISPEQDETGHLIWQLMEECKRKRERDFHQMETTKPVASLEDVVRVLVSIEDAVNELREAQARGRLLGGQEQLR